MSDLKEINIILGGNIKFIRKKRNMTREKLSEIINISTRFLADVESGKVGVSLSTLKSLCNALNISADYLLGISELKGKNMYISSIENKIKNMNANTLKNIDKILDCITDIENDREKPTKNKSVQQAENKNIKKPDKPKLIGENQLRKYKITFVKPF